MEPEPYKSCVNSTHARGNRSRQGKAVFTHCYNEQLQVKSARINFRYHTPHWADYGKDTTS